MNKIGVDIIEIKRVEQTYRRFQERFLRRIFTESEINYAFQFTNPFPHLAVRFAAKEALFKAMNRSIPFSGIEILGRPPQVKINGRKEVGVSISLSHNREQAIAVVLWEDIEN